MRAVVQLAARGPATGRYQIVLIEDADRLTEGASNALLKAVEEPAQRSAGVKVGSVAELVDQLRHDAKVI